MGQMKPILSPHRRAAIESEIDLCLQRVERLLARLDRADAPSEDLEDDDPAGTDIDLGEGEGEHGRGLLPTRPLWGLNQTTGPVNYQAAQRDYIAAEMGLVRSSTGGWRQA